MKNVYLIPDGDLRLSAKGICEKAQTEMESKLIASLNKERVTIIRGHRYNPVKKQGFIDSQKFGIQEFCSIPGDAPSIVGEALG